MNRDQLKRYSRHIFLPEVGVQGQERLLQSKVLVIGAGGLGCPAALYLASSGVGQLVISDDDVVEVSNLQRQIGHYVEDVGRLKVDSLAAKLQQINPELILQTRAERLQGTALMDEVAAVDVVVDASDNFATRFLINEACVMSKTPLVSGAVVRFEGQVTVVRPDRENSPCYQCLYPDGEELDCGTNCAQSGVLAPLTGVIAGLQVAETIKVLLNMGESLSGRLLRMDALSMQWRESRIAQDPHCTVCGVSGFEPRYSANSL